jgi:hypothetical protein
MAARLGFHLPPTIPRGTRRPPDEHPGRTRRQPGAYTRSRFSST